MKKNSLVILFLLLTTFLIAQTKYERWNIGVHLNSTHYQGDLGSEFINFTGADPGASLSLAYYISPTFDITAKIGWSYLEFMDKNGTYGFGNKGYADATGYYNPSSKEGWKFYGSFFNTSVNIKVKSNNGWLLPKDTKLAPFVVGGLGVTRFHSTSVTDHISKDIYQNMSFYYGTGLNFALSERFNILFEAGIYNPMTDVYDGIDENTVTRAEAADRNDSFLQYSFGITYDFGYVLSGCRWD